MMKEKKVSTMKSNNWWKYIVGVGLIIMYLLPIYVLVVMSFKGKGDYGSYLALPEKIVFDNYIKIIKSGKVISALKNTAIVSVSVVALEVIFGCMAAYPLSRNKSKFNQYVNSFIMAAMMIPALSILVGVYTEIVKLGGINHLWAVVFVEVAFGIPLSIYLYSNFISSIPKALDEAATVDGAGVFRIFWSIILPQLKPVTVTVMILKGVGAWNNYLYPSYILQKPSKYTLVLLIKQYFGSSSSVVDLNSASAVAVLCVMPLIIVYLCLQKYFIKGQIDSAVK